MKLGVLGLLGALVPAGVTAQTRDVRTSAGTAVITGVVVSDDADAKPVRKARVTYGGPDAQGNTTITDDQGRFVFAGLPAGRYTIAASKPTWITTSYGAKRPRRGATPIPLGDGQKIQIVLRLTRGAVITGVVLDHDNQPASAVQVRALRYEVIAGERRLVDAGSATTDDRGVYRIFGLTEGEYFVTASTRSLGGMTAGDLQLTSDADVRDAAARDAAKPAPPRTVSLAPVYYPGGTSVSQAGVIALRPGEERTGVDLALQLVRTARVEGTVMLPEGGVPVGTELNLIAAGATAAAWQSAESYRRVHPGTDGAFAFAGIPPGTYSLIARGSRPITKPDGTPAPAQMVWAATQIAVDGESIVGLVLSLEPGLTIAGRVQFQDSTLKPPDVRSIGISTLPVDTQTMVNFAPAGVTPAADGRFVITGVMPGRYRLSAAFPGSGRPGGWQLDSITAAAQDALDNAFILQPNQHILDALVTFTDRLAQVSGTVRTAAVSPADQTVVLFAEDQRLWFPQSRRIQGTRVGSDGAYLFRSVPAGTYLLALTDEVENGEWFDPEVLQRLIPSAVRVTVRGREPIVKDLK
jgi:hypothetical protein